VSRPALDEGNAKTFYCRAKSFFELAAMVTKDETRFAVAHHRGIQQLEHRGCRRRGFENEDSQQVS
jgi:hypothetical protein